MKVGRQKPKDPALLEWLKSDVIPVLLRKIDEQEDGARQVIEGIAEGLSEERATAYMYGDINWDCPLCEHTNKTSFMSENDTCEQCSFTVNLTYDF